MSELSVNFDAIIFIYLIVVFLTDLKFNMDIALLLCGFSIILAVLQAIVYIFVKR
jgi:hypothetical protein